MSQPQPRKPTNLSLDHSLLSDARALKINLSRAAEHGIRQAISETRAAQWKAENAEALEASNRFAEQHGLPLSHLRQF